RVRADSRQSRSRFASGNGHPDRYMDYKCKLELKADALNIDAVVLARELQRAHSYDHTHELLSKRSLQLLPAHAVAIDRTRDRARERPIAIVNPVSSARSNNSRPPRA